MPHLPRRLRSLLWAILALLAVAFTDGEGQAAAISPLEVALHASADGVEQAAWVQPWSNGLPDAAEEALRESGETSLESDGGPAVRAFAGRHRAPPAQVRAASELPAPHLRSAGRSSISSGRPPPGRGWSERGPPASA